MEEEIFELIPSLRERAKKSIRVLPQQGEEPDVNATKLGGKFLWSKDEPWIYCDVPEVALLEDYKRNNGSNESVDAFGQDLSNIWDVSHPKHNDAFIPILQLRSEDVPVIRFPDGKNILQLLWCPREHYEIYSPLCRVFWQNENKIVSQLEKMPEPSYPEEYELTPEPSVVLLEEVSEFPHFWALSSEERNLLNDEQKDFYWKHLSTHKGIKVGGHPDWIQDPEIPVCSCGREMEHLLTIGSDVFEDYPNHKAPGLCLGDAGSIYVFICYNCEELPIETVFQCS